MVKENLEIEVRDFILNNLPTVTSIFMKKIAVGDDEPLQKLHEWDDVGDMADAYFKYFNVKAEVFSLKIMKDYFARFNVDDSSFDFLKYWPHGTGFLPNALRPRSMRVEEKEPEPLTIAMLIESAKAGRWLYD